MDEYEALWRGRADRMRDLLSEVTIVPDGAGSTMWIRRQFPSQEAMQELLDMGMEDGIREAVAQMDAILAED